MRLVVENLACRRGGRRILSGLSLRLADGEALVVTGRNGAGKSTLLALLSGRLAPEAGSMHVEGVGERTLPECLHLVGHRDALKSALTAAENLAFARAILGRPALDPQAALATFGLGHAADLPVAYLSAGQRRRVALARLLVARRPLWLLDEPTAALDAGSQETLLAVMNRHLGEGGSIIVATHQALALQNAKELAIGRQETSPRPAGRGPRPPSPGGEASAAERSGGEGVATEVLDPESPPHLRPSGLLRHPTRGDEALSPPAGRGVGRSALLALFLRDLRLAARVGGSGALGLIFFLMIVTLVPFALGPDLNLLARIGPAILWLAAVLATLIGLDRLFQADEDDGSLDLLRASQLPLALAVVAKAAAHWAATGLPLALAAPLFGLLVALTPQAMAATALTLLVGTPALTFVGAVGAALTASIRRGGLILAVLVLPLMIPTLIFGVSAANAAIGGTVPFGPPFLILAALTLVAGVIGTVAAAAALRWGE